MLLPTIPSTQSVFYKWQPLQMLKAQSERVSNWKVLVPTASHRVLLLAYVGPSPDLQPRSSYMPWPRQPSLPTSLPRSQQFQVLSHRAGHRNE